MKETMLVLAIDIGTTVAKVVLFESSGKVSRLARAATPLLPSQGGRSEIDMNALWRRVLDLIGEVVADREQDVEAIALSGTSCGAFIIDPKGEPVCPAILWNDGRAAYQIDAWRTDGTLEEVFRLSGNVMFPGFTAAVLRHLQTHDPASLARARSVVCCKDWIRFRMTGHIATDMSDASYMPFDIAAGRFSREIWALCGIKDSFGLLPELVEPDAVAGFLTRQAANYTGLRQGIPVIAGMTDVASATLGAGALSPGDACTILGTSCLNSLMTSEAPLDGPPLGITARTLGGTFIRSMVNTAGTMNIDWYLREMGGAGHGLDDLEATVAQSPPGARGIFYLPYLNNTGVLSPFVHPHARAQFFGLSVEHTRADLARSVLEGVAFAIRDCYAAMPAFPTSIRLVGGGTRNSAWCQMIADCLGIPAYVMELEEPGAWGVAMLALRALDPSRSFTDLTRLAEVRATHMPDMALHRRYGELFQLYRRVAQASFDIWTDRARLLDTPS